MHLQETDQSWLCIPSIFSCKSDYRLLCVRLTFFSLPCFELLIVAFTRFVFDRTFAVVCVFLFSFRGFFPRSIWPFIRVVCAVASSSLFSGWLRIFSPVYFLVRVFYRGTHRIRFFDFRYLFSRSCDTCDTFPGYFAGFSLHFVHFWVTCALLPDFFAHFDPPNFACRIVTCFFRFDSSDGLHVVRFFSLPLRVITVLFFLHGDCTCYAFSRVFSCYFFCTVFSRVIFFLQATRRYHTSFKQS